MSIERGSAAGTFALTRDEEASELGMWVFLATEVLMFGGFFVLYVAYRLLHPAAFSVGSGHLNVVLGTVNTTLLMTSSLTMALAVNQVVAGHPRRGVLLLAATWLLGAAFLVIKGIEYSHEWHGGLPAESAPVRGFLWLYFAMTGLHAAHLLSGLLVLGYFPARMWLKPDDERLPRRLPILGLYWHLIDVLWLFIFPLFYLVGRHAQL